MDSFHRIVDEMTPRTLVRRVIDTAPPQDTPSDNSSHHTSGVKKKTKRKSGGDELRTKVLLQQQQQQSVNTSEVRGTDQTYANIADLTAIASDDDSINESINLDAAAKFYRKIPQRPVELSDEMAAKLPVPSPTKKRKPLDDAIPETKTREKRSRISETGAAERTLEGDKTYGNLSTNTLDSSLESISYDIPKRQQGSQKRLLVNLDGLDIGISQDITQISLNVTEEDESFETDTRQKFALVAQKKRMELNLSGVFKDPKTLPMEKAKGTALDTASDMSKSVSMTDEVLEEEFPVRSHKSVSSQSMLSSPGSKTPSSGKRTTPQPRELLQTEVTSPRKEVASPKPNTSLSKPKTPQTPVSGSRITRTATPRSRTPTHRPRTATPGSRLPTLRHTTASPGSKTPTSGLHTTRAGSKTPTSGLHTTRAGSNTPTSGLRTTRAGSKTPTSGLHTTRAGSKTPTSGLRTTRAGSKTPTSGLHTTRAGSETPTFGFRTRAGSRTPTSGLRTTRAGSRTPTSGLRTTRAGSKTPTFGFRTREGSRTPTSGLRTTRAGSKTPTSGLRTTRAGSRTPTQKHTATSLGSTTPSSRSKSVTPSPSRSPTLRLKIVASPGAVSPSLKSPLKVSSLTHSAQPQSSTEKSKGEEAAEAPTIPPPPSFQDAGEVDEVVRSSFSSSEGDELQVNISRALLLIEGEEEKGEVSDRVTRSYSSQSSAGKNVDVFASVISRAKSPGKGVIRELFGTPALSPQKTEATEESPYFQINIDSLSSASPRASQSPSASPSMKTASPIFATTSPSMSQTSTSFSALAEPLSSESDHESSSQLKSSKQKVVTVATVHRVSEQDEQGLVTLGSEREDLLIDVGSEEDNMMKERDEEVIVDDKEGMDTEDEEKMIDIGEEAAVEEAVEVMASQGTDEVDVEGISETPRGDEGEKRMTNLTLVEEDAEEHFLKETKSAEGRTSGVEGKPVDDDDNDQLNFIPVVKRPIRRSTMQTQAEQEQQRLPSSMMNVSVAMSNISTDEGTPPVATDASSSRVIAPQPRQLTMKEFIQTLATKPIISPSVTSSANTRLADMMKKLQESCAGHIKTKKPARPKGTASQKKTKKKELPAGLSKKQTMEAFTHFSRCKVSAGAVGQIVEVCEEWWSNVLGDLEFLKQTRSTPSSDEITAEDVARLMKRQGLTTTQTELIALVEEYLPAEEWMHFKSTAYAHDKIFPNHVQTLLPD